MTTADSPRVENVSSNHSTVHLMGYIPLEATGVYDELVERGSTQGTSQQFELGCGNIAGCSVIVSLEDAAAQGGVVLKEVPVKEKGIMTHLKALVTKKLIVLKLVVECMNDTVISLDDCDGVVLPVFRIHVYFTDELFGYFSKDAVHEPSVREKNAVRAVVFAMIKWPHPSWSMNFEQDKDAKFAQLMRLRGNNLRDSIFHAVNPHDWEATFDTPKDMKCSLFKYQKRALSWMYWRENESLFPHAEENSIKMRNHLALGWLPLHLQGKDSTIYFNTASGQFSRETVYEMRPQGGILADEMGLGKTVEIIALILFTRHLESQHRKREKVAGFLSGGTLVVCPPALLQQWRSELSNHAGTALNVTVYEGIRSLLDNNLEFEEASSSKRVKLDPPVEAAINKMIKASKSSRYGVITQDMIREAQMYARRAAGEAAPFEDPTETVLNEAAKLANADVVLTSFDVLQREIHYDSTKNERRLRHAKRYLIPDCALLKVHFYRIVTDEAQMMCSLKQAAEMTEKIVAEKRWCVTGTPMVSADELGDIKSLLSFLKMINPNFDAAWRSNVVENLHGKNHDAGMLENGWRNLLSILTPIMWRVDKVTVREEFVLPQRSMVAAPLRLQAGESELYNQLVEKARQAYTALEVANESLQALSDDHRVRRSFMKKIDKIQEEERSSILQLRLACIHPQLTKFWREEMAGDLQIGTGGMTSMEEVLQRLVDREQGDLQEAERSICAHLNTLAMKLLDKIEKISHHSDALSPVKPTSPTPAAYQQPPQGDVFDEALELLNKTVKNIDRTNCVDKAIECLLKSHRVSEKGIDAIDATSEDEVRKLPDPEALSATSWSAWRRIQINTAQQLVRAFSHKEGDFKIIVEQYREEGEKRLKDYFLQAKQELEKAKESEIKLTEKSASLGDQARSLGKNSESTGFPVHWGSMGSYLKWEEKFKRGLQEAMAQEVQELQAQSGTTEHLIGDTVKSFLAEEEKRLRTYVTPLESWVTQMRISTALEELQEEQEAVRSSLASEEESKEVPFKELRYKMGRWANLLTPFKRDSILNQFGRVLPVPREVKRINDDGTTGVCTSIVLAEEALGFSRPRETTNPSILRLAAQHVCFIPSDSWQGTVKGYSFYMNDGKLGYHMDSMAQVSQESPVKYSVLQCADKITSEFLKRLKTVSKGISKEENSLFSSLRLQCVTQRFEMGSKMIELVRVTRDLHVATATKVLKQKVMEDIEEDARIAGNEYPVKNDSRNKLVSKLKELKIKAIDMKRKKAYMQNRLMDVAMDPPGLATSSGKSQNASIPEEQTSKQGTESGDSMTYGPSKVELKAPGVDCPVCLVPIHADVCLWSHCGHAFCRECTDALFRGTKSANCPICRAVCSYRHVFRVAPQKKSSLQISKMKEHELDPTAADDPVMSSISAGSEWSIKISALLRRILALRSSAPEEKSLVFSQFPEALRVVSLALKAHHIAHVSLYGRGKHAAAAVRDFREDETVKVFLISQRAGAQGLTLVRANHVFLLEPSIDPAIEQQAISRVHRIGQLRPVRIVRLFTLDTIEEEVIKLQKRRQEIFNDSVDADGDGEANDCETEDASDAEDDAFLGGEGEATTLAVNHTTENMEQDEVDRLLKSVLK